MKPGMSLLLGVALSTPLWPLGNDYELALNLSVAPSAKADSYIKTGDYPDLVTSFDGPWRKIGVAGGMELLRVEQLKLWGRLGYETGLGSQSYFFQDSLVNQLEGSVKLSQITCGLALVFSTLHIGEYEVGLMGRSSRLDLSGARIISFHPGPDYAQTTTLTDLMLRLGVTFPARRPTFTLFQRISLGISLSPAKEVHSKTETVTAGPSKDLMSHVRPGTELTYTLGWRF